MRSAAVSDVEKNKVDFFVEHVVYDEWQVRHGHPTVALIHFFKNPDIAFPDALFDTTIQIEVFIKHLYSVLLCSIEHCKFIDMYRSPLFVPFACPCDQRVGSCGSLSISLRTRLSVLQVALEVLKLNANPRILNWVYLHIDSHMPLMCAMRAYETKCRVQLRDEQLARGCAVQRAVGTYVCTDAVMRKLLTSAPISIDFSFSEYSVPDTSLLVSLAITYGDKNKTTSNKKIVQNKFPHLNTANLQKIQCLLKLIYKGFPGRCFNRQLWKFIRHCCKISVETYKKRVHKRETGTDADSDMISFFMRMFVASLLGVYQTSKHKIENILARMKIYRLLYEPVSVESFASVLVDGNKISIVYMVKEYVYNMISRCPGIKKVFEDVHDWALHFKFIDVITHSIRANVELRLKSEDLRSSMSSSYNLSTLLATCDTLIVALHEESRKHQQENNVDYDVRVILRACSDMNLKMYNQDADMDFAGMEYMLKSPHPSIDPKLEQLMADVISTFHPRQWIPMDWLQCFGIARADVMYMQTAVFGKITNLMRHMKQLYTVKPLSYALFYAFFRLSQVHKDYVEYYSSARMYLAHCHALNEVHGVGKGGTIPAVLGRFHYCPVCGDKKRPSFFSTIKRNKNGRGAGIVRVCIDGTMVCGRKPKSANWLQLRNNQIRKDRLLRVNTPDDEDDEEDEQSDPDDDDDDEDEDGGGPINYNDEGEHSCSDRRIDDNDDMPSCIIPEPKKNLPASTQTVCTVNRKNAKYISLQHELNKCKDTVTRSIAVLGKIVEWKQQAWIGCMHCIRPILLILSYDVDGKKLCKDCFSMQTLASHRPKCEATGCIKKTRDDEFKKLLVYDDISTPASYRHMLLCRTHASYMWIAESETILRTSVIFQGFREKWGTRQGPKTQYIYPPDWFRDM